MNPQEIIKQSIGVDIAKDKFDVRFGTTDIQGQHKFLQFSAFDNSKTGFKRFVKWIQKVIVKKELPVYITMEATGVYYENLAYYLESESLLCSVVLPSQTKKYKESLNQKSKTDNLDAQMLCQYGLERPFEAWVKPNETMRKLKVLTRQYQTIKEQIVENQNRLHAIEHSFEGDKTVIKILNDQINFLEEQEKELLKEIEKLIDSDPDIKSKVDNLTSIKGVGLKTVAAIIAETNAFRDFNNVRQLTSYAGLDVVHNQSGNREGKTRISKKGNSHIRKALYMAALVASRYNEYFCNFKERLQLTKTNGKVILVAICRKLLILLFSLWKNNSTYNPDYHKNLKTA